MAKIIVPQTRPKLLQLDAEKLLDKFNLGSYPVRILGIRGYYKKTMGNPIANDRNIYDDAIFIISPENFSAYNANTDPSVTRPGVAVVKKDTVTLYKIGLHGLNRNPYKALRQHGNVTVIRDNRGEFTDKPSARFWINIHRGGYNTTSSLGCHTIHPTQWNSFISTAEDQMKRFDQKIVPFALIEF